MADIPLLAQTLTIFLAPALPYLTNLAGKAAEKAAGKLGEDTWTKAKEIWDKLRPKVAEQKAAEIAVQEVVEEPDEEANKEILTLHLTKILAKNPALAQEVQQLIVNTGVWRHNQAKVRDWGVNVQGDKSMAVGAKSTVVQGNLTQIEHQTIQTPSLPPGTTDEPTLRNAYLHQVIAKAGSVDLTGIDKSVRDAEEEARVDLQAVYTALWTQGREEIEPREESSRQPEEPRRLSALAQLDRHKRLVLLGDPGSGKSTFVNFVALCHAGELLGRSEANLEILTAPLPADNNDAEPQPWSHGAMLPVRIILRDFAARGLPPVDRQATAEHVWSFLEEELQKLGLAAYAPHLQKHLQETGGLILLDGLDEVPEAEARREQLCQAVSEFADGLSECRFLVTSRTYAYQKQKWRLNGFEEAVLAPFTEEQIHLFIGRWYEHVGRVRGLEDAEGRAEALRRAVFSSPRLRSLAERPLLLTLMSSLHAWRGGTLPEKREELYADTVDLLLDFWEQQRTTFDAEGKKKQLEPSFQEYLKVDRLELRHLLNRLAFEAHGSQSEDVGTADVPEGDLLSGLLELCDREDDEVDSARLLRYLNHRAGILIPRGVGVYTFPHRTLQEYLAACHLTDQDFPEQVANLARAEPNRWREVALLAGAKAARGAASTVWQLADALCHRKPDDDEVTAEDEWGALLAGELLVESANLDRVSDHNVRKLERVRAWQVELLGSRELPAVERAKAGVSLARLGDPRFSERHWFLPADPLLGFVEVPKGRFLMGEGDVQHELDLSLFFMSRYPVTVGQWRAFVESSGHVPSNRDSLRGVSNHPVVWVSWHDALAYCEWLTEGLHEISAERLTSAEDDLGARFWGGLSRGELVATLPSEAEWEKAARGTDGRVYPWGEEASVELASTRETGLGGPSPVGCFPRGASPSGCEEMSGNVWEWTRSSWGGYPYPMDGTREDLAKKDESLVVRGGAFFDDLRAARCACRLRDLPRNPFRSLGFRVVCVPFLQSL